MLYDMVPLIPFWAMLLLWLFPFSVFLPLEFRRPAPSDPNTTANGAKPNDDKPQLFLWLWAGVVMVFFSFSTRQEYYTMPAWPPLAILIALALDRAESEKS